MQRVFFVDAIFPDAKMSFPPKVDAHMTSPTEFHALQKSIQRSKVERAKRQSPVDKLFDGARLYDLARQQTLSAIAAEHPDWLTDEVGVEYRRRLKLVRDREERNVYTIVEDGTHRDE